jgi:serine/threonine-protein kinase HipA
MKTGVKEIQVYANWESFPEPRFMGLLKSTLSKGKEIFSFEYSKEWLDAGEYKLLDPDLQFYAGHQYLRDDKPNFGIFLDSSPDRWGRTLIQRREIELAKSEQRDARRLTEIDYLLGVYDETRMGGIRFKKPDGDFLNNEPGKAAPPWSSLRELEHASRQIENDEIGNEKEYIKWLSLLLAPGSSLGGARPKASIVDGDGNLYIAKFPGKNDDNDVGAWEMVIHTLAKNAGLNVPEAQIRKLSGKHHTFLSKRFDRKKRVRVHFASAMTLFGYKDGDTTSYLEFVQFLSAHGARVTTDLEEVWRRIVFNICVSNTDDHLRNHGFLLTNSGWVLSPAYDMNPNKDGAGLHLFISEDDNSLSLDLARETAKYYRIPEKRVEEIISQVRASVATWSKVAEKIGIAKSEIQRMETAFQISG